MHAASPPPAWLRWVTFAVLPMLIAGLLAAQSPKKPVDEEEIPKKGGTKKVVIDEEENPMKAKKKVIVDDEPKKKPMETKPVKPPTPVEDDKIDLNAEAAKATHPDIQALFRDLANERDILRHRQTGEINVVPVEAYIGDRPNEVQVRYTALLAPGKPDKLSTQAGRGELISAKHYEEIAIERVNRFLEDGQTRRNPSDRNHIPLLDQLTASDKVLSAALKFHETARKSEKRKGPGWDALRERLRSRLQEVLSDELAELNVRSAGDKALMLRAADLAFRIGESFPDNIKALRDVAVWKLNQASNDLGKADEYISGAKTLQRLIKQFPTVDGKVLDPLRDKLKRRAQMHLDEAKKLGTTDDGKFLALRQVEFAELIYADLEGLKEYATQVARSYRMIVVGVPSLPERMSPPLAITDADRWACELLFESLIQAVPDAQVGQRWRTQLAALPPGLVPMGREFQMVSDAVWATKDGPADKIDAYAVRGSLALMREHAKSSYSERIDVLQPPNVQDPFRFRLQLDRGCLDPLSAMSFKLLPATILDQRGLKLMDPEFASNPIGSGPFVYYGRRTEDGKEFVVFKANPAYGKRQGKFGLPRIQEIRFVVAPADPAADLREGKIDLLLDVSTPETLRLRTPDLGLARVVKEVTLPTRRIWMLAVNHRKPELGGETGKPLRRALAHAIDREEILKQFRVGTPNHRALAGPFPPDTWTVPTKSPPAPLFRPEYAQAMIKQAKAPDSLTLKFTDTEQSRKACAAIKQQIEAQNLGVRIELMPMAPAALHQAVHIEHDFQLAYLPYDFNDTYSLNGLFDPDAVDRGQRNYMGVVPDATLARLLREARTTRNFDQVRGWTQALFSACNDQMPYIPLWQLDFHLVVNQNLQPAPAAAYLDPLTIFDQCEEWRVNR